jgi:beta-glucosidase-like glycosyl hydrolase
MNHYSRLIPRLNGADIERNFAYYRDLAKKGVAGFIIFGGELETVREGIRELRTSSANPLFIASDLEQGLGQQIQGGTLFPPAMAIASALKGLDRNEAASILQQVYSAFAIEAKYAGIDTIFAPVLDVNTNPENPIIATRAFGEDPETVSFFGCEMVRILEQNGITACGKHFPGHGDTEIDSHIGLPVVRKDLSALESMEIVPFGQVIREGVGMIMLGHLSVPAMDPSGEPATVSRKIIAYLRSRLNFEGIVISDAMNMGALAGYDEDEASLMALDAGVDIILHPSDPDRTASYLLKKNWKSGSLKHRTLPEEENKRPDFDAHQKLSDDLSSMAVMVKGGKIAKISRPFLVVLKEDKEKKGTLFLDLMKERYGDLDNVEISHGEDIPGSGIAEDRDLMIAVFSQVRAWKGRTGNWLSSLVEKYDGKAKAVISFGNPYVLRNVLRSPKIFAYWDAPSAQESVASLLMKGNA